MGTNVRNPNSILMGTGILYVGGMNVGQLTGDVVVDLGTEEYKIEAGFPRATIKKYIIKEPSTISAAMLEVDPAVLAVLFPRFTAASEASGTVVVPTEHVGAISSTAWRGLAHRNVLTADFSLSKGSVISVAANPGDTVVNVANSSGFTAGDSVTLAGGGKTETKTVASVQVSAKTITIIAGLTNGYSLGATVSNGTDALTITTDYLVNPLDGQVLRVEGSSALLEGDTVVASYSYTQQASRSLSFGGKISSEKFPIVFEHERDDGVKVVVELYSGQLAGNLAIPFSDGKETVVGVVIEGTADSSRAKGDQIGRISWVG